MVFPEMYLSDVLQMPKVTHTGMYPPTHKKTKNRYLVTNVTGSSLTGTFVMLTQTFFPFFVLSVCPISQ